MSESGIASDVKPRTGQAWIAAGAASAFLAVALGAFGAHALRNRISADRLDVFQTGAHYHLIHSLARVLVGNLLRQKRETRQNAWVGRLVLSGILLCRGSLYLLAMTGIRTFGAITPLGGVCFMTAWALLSLYAMRNPHS